jgi:hypothetical protein
MKIAKKHYRKYAVGRMSAGGGGKFLKNLKNYFKNF